ncbi:MAG: DUF1697 domain-containing protein [Caldilineales bacterium]|nr:DUF1697 domain-containing protein [Caldilineales bacterium]
MSTHISLLRGINVSGQKKILMADLRALYKSLGLANVESYVQSGNVLFDSDEDAATLKQRIEAGIERVYDYHVDVVLRTPADFARVLANNPYLVTRNVDTKQTYVIFLAQSPDPDLAEALAVADGSDDEFTNAGEEIYLYLPGGAGRTKLTNNFFERKLKLSATTRNWRTVEALYEMARARSHAGSS